MSKQKIAAGFKSFLTKFPKAKLPCTVDEKTSLLASKTNKPLSEDHIRRFLAEAEEEFDEFTEFVACFRLPETKNFHAIVVWKGGLLSYEYQLFIYDMKGAFQSKTRIAGTNVTDDRLHIQIAEIRSSLELALFSGTFSADTTSPPLQELASAGILKLNPANGEICPES
ncbi:MAG: hypothetical protein AAFV80_07355 [Bacteroidota bacterium]